MYSNVLRVKYGIWILKLCKRGYDHYHQRKWCCLYRITIDSNVFMEIQGTKEETLDKMISIRYNKDTPRGYLYCVIWQWNREITKESEGL